MLDIDESDYFRDDRRLRSTPRSRENVTGDTRKGGLRLATEWVIAVVLVTVAALAIALLAMSGEPAQIQVPPAGIAAFDAPEGNAVALTTQGILNCFRKTQLHDQMLFEQSLDNVYISKPDGIRLLFYYNDDGQVSGAMLGVILPLDGGDQAVEERRVGRFLIACEQLVDFICPESELRVPKWVAEHSIATEGSVRKTIVGGRILLNRVTRDDGMVVRFNLWQGEGDE